MNITIYGNENPMPREYFTRLYAIMEYSFPKDERRGLEEQFAEFEKPRFRSLVHEEDGEIAGFMNYWQLSGFVYLEHFAVARELRGRGMGAALMEELCGATDCPIILEAEPPEQDETAARRIRFYERLGFRLNPYEYYQPPYRDGDIPVRLMIMSKPSPLSEAEFREVRSTLYREAYETDESFTENSSRYARRSR